MAIKVAPEQGWGIHWNDAHPDQPFTPVTVSLTSPSFATGSGQASLASGGSAAFQANVVSPQITSAPQSVSVPGAVTDFHIDQSSTVAAGATVSNFSSGGATITMSSGSIFPTLDHAGDPGVTITLADNTALPADGWFIVPSAENEYGQAYAAGDGFGFDVATGDFASDWVFIA